MTNYWYILEGDNVVVELYFWVNNWDGVQKSGYFGGSLVKVKDTYELIRDGSINVIGGLV